MQIEFFYTSQVIEGLLLRVLDIAGVALNNFRILNQEGVHEQGNPASLGLIGFPEDFLLRDVDGFVPERGQAQCCIHGLIEVTMPASANLALACCKCGIICSTVLIEVNP